MWAVKAQHDGELTSKVLANDGREILLCFKVLLCYVIGDVEGHDYLCARYGNHANTKCLCQECDCLTDDADDPNVICNYIKASHLKLLHDANSIIKLK